MPTCMPPSVRLRAAAYLPVLAAEGSYNLYSIHISVSCFVHIYALHAAAAQASM
jgi:hypothetical protein